MIVVMMTMVMRRMGRRIAVMHHGSISSALAVVWFSWFHVLTAQNIDLKEVSGEDFVSSTSEQGGRLEDIFWAGGGGGDISKICPSPPTKALCLIDDHLNYLYKSSMIKKWKPVHAFVFDNDRRSRIRLSLLVSTPIIHDDDSAGTDDYDSKDGNGDEDYNGNNDDEDADTDGAASRQVCLGGNSGNLAITRLILDWHRPANNDDEYYKDGDDAWLTPPW